MQLSSPVIPMRPYEIINTISQGRPDEIERNFMWQVARNLLDYSVENIMFHTKTQGRKENALMANGHWYLNCLQVDYSSVWAESKGG